MSVITDDCKIIFVQIFVESNVICIIFVQNIVEMKIEELLKQFPWIKISTLEQTCGIPKGIIRLDLNRPISIKHYGKILDEFQRLEEAIKSIDNVQKIVQPIKESASNVQNFVETTIEPVIDVQKIVQGTTVEDIPVEPKPIPLFRDANNYAMTLNNELKDKRIIIDNESYTFRRKDNKTYPCNDNGEAIPYYKGMVGYLP